MTKIAVRVTCAAPATVMRQHETLRTPRQFVHAFIREPPGWAFHGVMAAGMAGYLYAVSFPGVAFFLAGVSSATLLAVAVLWVVRALGIGSVRRRGEDVGSAARLLVAPMCGLLLITVVWFDAPLRVRWAASRPAFEKVAKASENGRLPTDHMSYSRIGLYRVGNIRPVPNGLIFYERTGNLFNDAGFAYLPDGPSASLANGSFESPQWRALGNHWYAWTASW